MYGPPIKWPQASRIMLPSSPRRKPANEAHFTPCNLYNVIRVQYMLLGIVNVTMYIKITRKRQTLQAVLKQIRDNVDNKYMQIIYIGRNVHPHFFIVNLSANVIFVCPYSYNKLTSLGYATYKIIMIWTWVLKKNPVIM